jgi:4-aminobutyrate aminotransferase-like enzyme
VSRRHVAEEGSPWKLAASFDVSRVVSSWKKRRFESRATRTGPNENVLKIRPPLVFTTEHAELLVDALAAALGGTIA